MGNHCATFLDQPTLTLSPRTLPLSNAPSTKYALRLKNHFPPLQPHIQQIRSKINFHGVDEIIRNCPVYFIYQKNAVYQGQWENGEPHGYGRAVYADFSYYEGLFKHSQPCTFITPDHYQDSVYIFSDGTYYQGEFRDSKFSGKGTLIKQGVIRMVGSFKDGVPHGEVIQTLVYHNEIGNMVQSTYEGNYVNGVKEGKGKFEDDKLLYVGDFHKGKPHGQGELVDYNGIQFKGKFYNGRRMAGQIKSGYGTIRGNHHQKSSLAQGYYEWKDGDKFYIGEIKNDKLHGEGRIYFNNGRVIKGVWKKGHNQCVTGVEQISQEEVKMLRKQHEEKFVDVNEEGMSRSGVMSQEDERDEQNEREGKDKVPKYEEEYSQREMERIING